MKAEIDVERTGLKVAAHGPGLSPLGTDDAPTGRPPGIARVPPQARSNETCAPGRAAQTSPGHGTYRWVMAVFAGAVLSTTAVIGMPLLPLR